MKINPKQLSASLKKNSHPLYIISGDEPLLIQEARDEIIASKKQRGFELRELVTIESNFNWESLYYATEASSLFAEKKILDIRNPQTKFDTFLHPKEQTDVQAYALE